MGQHRPNSHFVIRAVFCKKRLCFLFAAFKLRQKAFLYLFGNLNVSVLHILRYFQSLFHRIGFAVFPVRPLFIRQRQAVPSLGKNMMGKGHSVFLQSLCEQVAVFYRNRFVRCRLP